MRSRRAGNSTEKKLEIAEYLTVVPPLTASLQVPLQTFYQRYELVEVDPMGTLIHQTGIQTLPENALILVLDLDFVSQDVSQLQGMTAVSYTHLRAHETVLDLV